jgi:transposase
MRRFVEGTDRGQSTLFPECLEDWIDEDSSVRVIDVFVEELDLGELGFSGVDPEATGRPSYHPSVLLKLYIYGYLNRVQSSRRLEREAARNVEVMWLSGRLYRITRRLPTSARTMALPSARCAHASLRCAA